MICPFLILRAIYQDYIKGSLFIGKRGIELADVHAFENNKAKFIHLLCAFIRTEEEFYSKNTEEAKAKFLLDGLVYHIKKTVYGSNVVPTKPHGIEFVD